MKKCDLMQKLLHHAVADVSSRKSKGHMLTKTEGFVLLYVLNFTVRKILSSFKNLSRPEHFYSLLRGSQICLMIIL